MSFSKDFFGFFQEIHTILSDVRKGTPAVWLACSAS